MVPEFSAQFFNIWGVFRGGGLSFEQSHGGVAEAEQGAQLGGLGAWHLERAGGSRRVVPGVVMVGE